MRALGWILALVIGGCAASSAPPPAIPLPAPPPEVAVVPPAPLPPPEDPAVRERADAAVSAAEAKLAALATSCETDWLEPAIVCQPSVFEPLASDYQAYYAEHPTSAAENARLDSLARLGGPTSNVEQIAAALTASCENRCRTKRLPALKEAATAAAEACFKAKAGFDACKALTTKMAKSVRASELERWADECYGICDDKRRAARTKAAYEASRPKTRAEADACRAKCHREHDGGWCGTGLLACLGQCTTKAEERAGAPFSF